VRAVASLAGPTKARTRQPTARRPPPRPRCTASAQLAHPSHLAAQRYTTLEHLLPIYVAHFVQLRERLGLPADAPLLRAAARLVAQAREACADYRRERAKSGVVRGPSRCFSVVATWTPPADDTPLPPRGAVMFRAAHTPAFQLQRSVLGWHAVRCGLVTG
jgi:hypothetical protein